MKKALQGELVNIFTDGTGISFYLQNTQTLRAFLPWDVAFSAAVRENPKSGATVAQVPPKIGLGIRIVEVEEK